MVRRKLTYSVGAMVVALLLMGAACNKQQQGNNYQKVALASKTFSQGLGAAQDAEIVFYNAKKVSDDEHQRLQEMFLEAGKDGVKLDKAIQDAHSEQDVRNALGAAIKDIDALMEDGTLHIKSEEVKTSLRTGIIAAQTALATIQSVMGGNAQ